MRSLNPDQLRALAAVVETRSFSAAARKLHLTQPAVSLQIKALEDRFGVRLVERLGKQAHATAAGEELVAAAARLFRESDDIELRMRRYREGWMGGVTIGTISTVFTYDLPPLLRALRRRHPKIELQVTSLPTPESVERILDNRLDIAIITLPIDTHRLRVTPLRDETMLAIFPAGASAVPDVVSPSFVATQPLLMEHDRAAGHLLVRGWLERGKTRPNIPMQLGSIEALKSAVAAELGMAIIPDAAVARNHDDLVVRPLDPPLPSPIALIEHAGKQTTPALAIVREALLALRRDGVVR
jgi:DNA-binding transcriptional LysR family regulator